MQLIPFLLLGAASAYSAGMTAIDEAGYTKAVAAHKGKVVLVNFWATYCVPCRKEMPALVQMNERLKAKGFVFLTVSADEPEDAQRAAAFLEKTSVPAPHYLRKAKSDDAFINFIDPKWSGALPATFIYDRAGKKVKTVIGEADLKTLEAEVVKLLR